MENQVRENLRSMMYKNKLARFKSDVINFLNNGSANLNMFPGVAENIYKQAYAKENAKGLTAVLNECININKFFQETVNLALKSYKN